MKLLQHEVVESRIEKCHFVDVKSFTTSHAMRLLQAYWWEFQARSNIVG